MLPSPLVGQCCPSRGLRIGKKRSVKWQLLCSYDLAAQRPQPTTLCSSPAKPELAEFLQHTSSSTAVDVVRADAWLAICTLADPIAKNARANGEDRL